jgi:hypothetical protein
MQEAGMTRAQIAVELGVGAESVKDLLSDGRFYADPDARPERLALARQVEDLLEQGLEGAALRDALTGVSKMQANRAVRDAGALRALGV